MFYQKTSPGALMDMDYGNSRTSRVRGSNYLTDSSFSPFKRTIMPSLSRVKGSDYGFSDTSWKINHLDDFAGRMSPLRARPPPLSILDEDISVRRRFGSPVRFDQQKTFSLPGSPSFSRKQFDSSLYGRQNIGDYTSDFKHQMHFKSLISKSIPKRTDYSDYIRPYLQSRPTLKIGYVPRSRAEREEASVPIVRQRKLIRFRENETRRNSTITWELPSDIGSVVTSDAQKSFSAYNEENQNLLGKGDFLDDLPRMRDGRKVEILEIQCDICGFVICMCDFNNRKKTRNDISVQHPEIRSNGETNWVSENFYQESKHSGSTKRSEGLDNVDNAVKTSSKLCENKYEDLTDKDVKENVNLSRETAIDENDRDASRRGSHEVRRRRRQRSDSEFDEKNVRNNYSRPRYRSRSRGTPLEHRREIQPDEHNAEKQFAYKTRKPSAELPLTDAKPRSEDVNHVDHHRSGKKAVNHRRTSMDKLKANMESVIVDSKLKERDDVRRKASIDKLNSVHFKDVPSKTKTKKKQSKQNDFSISCDAPIIAKSSILKESPSNSTTKIQSSATECEKNQKILTNWKEQTLKRKESADLSDTEHFKINLSKKDVCENHRIENKKTEVVSKEKRNSEGEIVVICKIPKWLKSKQTDNVQENLERPKTPKSVPYVNETKRQTEVRENQSKIVQEGVTKFVKDKRTPDKLVINENTPRLEARDVSVPNRNSSGSIRKSESIPKISKGEVRKSSITLDKPITSPMQEVQTSDVSHERSPLVQKKPHAKVTFLDKKEILKSKNTDARVPGKQQEKSAKLKTVIKQEQKVPEVKPEDPVLVSENKVNETHKCVTLLEKKFDIAEKSITSKQLCEKSRYESNKSQPKKTTAKFSKSETCNSTPADTKVKTVGKENANAIDSMVNSETFNDLKHVEKKIKEKTEDTAIKKEPSRTNDACSSVQYANEVSTQISTVVLEQKKSEITDFKPPIDVAKHFESQTKSFDTQKLNEETVLKTEEHAVKKQTNIKFSSATKEKSSNVSTNLSAKTELEDTRNIQRDERNILKCKEITEKSKATRDFPKSLDASKSINQEQSEGKGEIGTFVAPKKAKNDKTMTKNHIENNTNLMKILDSEKNKELNSIKISENTSSSTIEEKSKKPDKKVDEILTLKSKETTSNDIPEKIYSTSQCDSKVENESKLVVEKPQLIPQLSNKMIAQMDKISTSPEKTPETQNHVRHLEEISNNQKPLSNKTIIQTNAEENKSFQNSMEKSTVADTKPVQKNEKSSTKDEKTVKETECVEPKPKSNEPAVKTARIPEPIIKPPRKMIGLFVQPKQQNLKTVIENPDINGNIVDGNINDVSILGNEDRNRKISHGSVMSTATTYSTISSDMSQTTEDIKHLSMNSPSKTFRFRKYGIDDFTFLKLLGKGSFGKVLLAELKKTNTYFAIKCLKKDVVLEDDDVESTMIERRVLALGTQHPYMCTLYCTFQTETHLCFVMEFLNGGDLMFHIQESGRFEQNRATFYGAEVVSALKFLHKRGIVYRDIKLDNVVLDEEGHIRLVDFGMCQCRIYREECMPFNFCGTPQYIAPEIVTGQKYNQSVDWWSFGVLLYEMLTGRSPFNGTDEDELFWSICNEEPSYPRFLSREAKSILASLLIKNPNERLGMPSCPDGEITQHQFFQSIDWNKLEKKALKPPFKPTVKYAGDTSNFDSSFTMDSATLTPVDADILQSMDQEQFKGFSYTNPNITG